jgi:hypothetical protein
LRWKSRRSRSVMLGTTSNRCAVKERPAPCETETPEPSLGPLAGSSCPRDPRSTPIPPDFPRWRRQRGARTQPSDRRIRLRKLSARLPRSESRSQALPPLLVSRA